MCLIVHTIPLTRRPQFLEGFLFFFRDNDFGKARGLLLILWEAILGNPLYDGS